MTFIQGLCMAIGAIVLIVVTIMLLFIGLIWILALVSDREEAEEIRRHELYD